MLSIKSFSDSMEIIMVNNAVPVSNAVIIESSRTRPPMYNPIPAAIADGIIK